MTRILLIGSTGFIGRQILAAWSASTTPEPRVLLRNRSAGSDDSQFIGDLNHPASLQEAMDGIEIVVNATSYLGSDPEAAERLYLQGTANLLDAAARAGVRRCLQMSTAAVYGSGPHRGIGVLDQSANPESMISRHRSIADQMVLDAGGTVLRPYLVYGPADRWFIPGVVKLFRRLGSQIEHGSARLSLISSVELGRLVAALALAEGPIGGIFHAAGPEPVRLSELVAQIESQIGPLGLSGSVSLPRAQELLGDAGFSRHQVSMIGVDSWLDAAPLWNRTGLPPSSFSLAEPATRAWYRSRIGT